MSVGITPTLPKTLNYKYVWCESPAIMETFFVTTHTSYHPEGDETICPPDDGSSTHGGPTSVRGRVHSRGVHGNGEDWDSHGNGSKISHGMGMGIKCMAMGVKTWELSPATVNSLLFLHSNWSKGSNAGGATA